MNGPEDGGTGEVNGPEDGGTGEVSGPQGAALTGWAAAWVRALEESTRDTARLARGRTYARDGGVDAIRVRPGRVTGFVHGSRPRPYRAELRLPVLSEDAWDAFLDTVAARPAHVAALLDGELPAAVAAEAEAAGVRLLPVRGEFVPVCSCPDRERPCKHAAALCYAAGRLLDDDPFVLLLIRGREENELLEELVRRSALLEADVSPGGPERTRPGEHPGRGERTGQPSGQGRGQGSALGPGSDGPSHDGEPSDPRTHGPSYPGSPDGPADPDGPIDTIDPTDPTDPGGGGGAAGAHPWPAGMPTVPAREFLAADVRPPLPAPLPEPEAPGEPGPYPDIPGSPGPDALAFLAMDAAQRAYEAFIADGDPLPGLSVWHDTIRLAATHPHLTGRRALSPLFSGLARTAGHTAPELTRAAAAWRQGGMTGLSVLDEPWDPPAGDFDRARSILAAAGLFMNIRRNHLTHPTRYLQLRYGRDGRWYPYRSDGDGAEWWPEGPAADDPLTALSGVQDV
ncbi:SWIM zinc finger family protein [Streptomyces iconiensis]|uniref:SWIM zinc finger family protein n=1 Tax=Streptomyces iconiensis TaxID=1384038 RepID=A0ABT6ZVS7_9ACTN|nr:SWIM zinc finger family protein [Streptomyces iconiensis]MDJ1133173.1 SWIM zinc finger family protein [Streptomyces iconiensis]